MNKIIIILVSLSLTGLFSCKKYFDEIEKNEGENDNGTLSATINGNNYTASIVKVSFIVDGLRVIGNELVDDEEMVIHLESFDPNTKTYNLTRTSSYMDNSTNTYVVDSGMVTIETATTTTAKGSFYFDAENDISATNGKFDVHWEN